MFFVSCSSKIQILEYPEVLKQTVHATKDSLYSERVDLALKYANSSATIVPEPKEKIKIEPILKINPKNPKGQKIRTIVVPEDYSGKEVVVVGSEQWDNLLKDAENAKVYKESLDLYKETAMSVSKQLNDQINKALILQKNIDGLHLKISQLETKVWKYKFILLMMGVIFVAWFYFKIKKSLIPLPL